MNNYEKENLKKNNSEKENLKKDHFVSENLEEQLFIIIILRDVHLRLRTGSQACQDALEKRIRPTRANYNSSSSSWRVRGLPIYDTMLCDQIFYALLQVILEVSYLQDALGAAPQAVVHRYEPPCGPS